MASAGSLSAHARPSALLLGSITRDLDGAGLASPGGVVHHAGLALARLGLRVRVVTRVRPQDAEELLAPLRAEGAEVRALPSRETTTYLNDYAGPIDRHVLCATSDPIEPDDIPAAWLGCDLAQLGPLHPRDLLPETAHAVGGLVGIDLQGLLRGGPAIRPDEGQLAHFVSRAHVVQVSEAELDPERAQQPLALARQFGRPELLITRGARGATLVCEERDQHVPAQRASGAHLVGAGDVLLGAYLALRLRGHAPLAAAHGASAVCAAKITHGQVPRDLDLEEVAA